MTIQIFFLVCGLLQRDGTPLSKMCSDIFIYRLPKLQEWLSARLFEEWCPKFGDKQRSRDKLKVSWEQLPHSPQRKGSDDKTFDCLYMNTHILRNRKEEICSPHVQSQNYTIFGSTDICGVTHVTQVLQWTVASYPRQTEKVKVEGLCSTEKTKLNFWRLAIDKRTDL